MHAHKEPESAKKAEGPEAKAAAGAEARADAEATEAMKAEDAEAPTPASAERQVKELTETLQRLQAEFENASKRMEKEKKEFMSYANASFVRELLPFVDSLEQGVAQAGKDAGAQGAQGLSLLRKQFLDVLAAHGFQEIKAAGQKFDPHLHEVMMNAEDPGKPEGVVLEEFQRGYRLKDLVLRPAKVKVNKLR